MWTLFCSTRPARLPSAIVWQRSSSRVDGIAEEELANAALQASLSDETAEGRSIVALAQADYGLSNTVLDGKQATFIPFAAQTRISGVDIGKEQIRKGAIDAILNVAGLIKDTAPRRFPEGG